MMEAIFARAWTASQLSLNCLNDTDFVLLHLMHDIQGNLNIQVAIVRNDEVQDLVQALGLITELLYSRLLQEANGLGPELGSNFGGCKLRHEFQSIVFILSVPDNNDVLQRSVVIVIVLIGKGRVDDALEFPLFPPEWTTHPQRFPPGTCRDDLHITQGLPQGRHPTLATVLNPAFAGIGHNRNVFGYKLSLLKRELGVVGQYV
mmetsp:Transcript_15133/g.32633  ORF Transcript_15133/g.32633 Transcript_15133/m.32633 type:complete len:204 (+) Transcript_15133:417-1028(+)